jgi:2-dehydro-3-deoxyphosphogluconate aldolase/(4S)-4-hydroxy-2-oxoglutarate aldolase
MPTGGVNVQNAHEWIQNGAVAIGIGSELTKPAKEGKYSEVTALAKQYVAIVKEARESRSLNI